MRVSVFLLLIFLIPTISQSQPDAEARLAGLDTFVEKVLEGWKSPGISIAVVEKDKVIFAGGFGFRDWENKLPVTQHTLFAIGSCTKAFTASMLGMLVKEGKLDLDQPVRDYLPELEFKNEYTNDHCTLRDMMSHRSGLPRHDYSWYGSTASRSELLKRIQYLEPSAELREKYQYNNFMFMAQGVVLEKITGKSWEQNLQERILDPLKMQHTNMSISALEENDDRSLAYTSSMDGIEKIPYRNIDAIGPAGSINSCASDMAQWLITWINGGSFDSTQIIPSSFWEQAITVQMATGGGRPGAEYPDLHSGGYGLAWGMSSYRGHYRVEHGGGIDGFSTTTCFFPTDSIGIFVVSNQGGPTSAVRNFIADRMLNLDYRDWSGPRLKEKIKAEAMARISPDNDSINQVKGTTPSHAMADYTGSYENKGYGVAKIFLENDTAWVDYNEGGKPTKSFLEHYHYDVFRILSTDQEGKNKNAIKLRFQTNEKGEISGLKIKMEPAVDEIEFVKLSPAFEVSRDALNQYVGEYDLLGTNIKVYLRGDGVLMVLVPGQPDYELVATMKDQFKLKVLDNYEVHFEVDAEEHVKSLSFVQPNGTFKAIRK
ncbi:MAG: serine hydrolase [Saprospiraceae bacterium]|nr:serine hydrolase [Saprospiraceae bacterium]